MPPTHHARTLPVLAIGCVATGILLVAGYAFFVWTAGGQQLDYAGYFGRWAENGFEKSFDGRLLGYVSPWHILLAGLFVCGVGALRGQAATGVVAAGAAMFAIFGAEWFKAVLPYPALVAPPGPVPAYFVACTYPSGHTTVGSSLAFALLLALPAFARRWSSLLAGLASAGFATAVLFLGWHRPSDALGGILWSGFCVGFASLAFLKLRRKNPALHPLGLPYLLASGACIVAVTLLAWCLSGNFASSGFRPGCGVFLGSVAAIIACAMGVAAWLGFALSPASAKAGDPPGR